MYNTEYLDLPYISNSWLSVINPEEGGSPQKYLEYLNNTRNYSSNKYSDIGTLIHAVLLENKQIKVISSYPSDTIKQIIDILYDSIENIDIDILTDNYTLQSYKDKILDIAKQINYGQTWQDETVIKKICESGQKYWEELIKDNNLIVSKQFYNAIEKIKYNINEKPEIKKLLEEILDIESISELEIIFDNTITIGKDKFIYKCKSKLDKVIIDHKEKTFSIIDIKTLAKKSVEFYQSSFDFYHTYRQIAFYQIAMYAYCTQNNLIGYKPSNHYIIAIEQNDLNNVKLFKINDKYIIKGTLEAISLINRIHIHTITNQWTYSLEDKLQTAILIPQE